MTSAANTAELVLGLSGLRTRTHKIKNYTFNFTLDVFVISEPVYGAAQGWFYWDYLPAQLTLGFVRAGEHFLFPHTHGVNGGARFAMQQASGDCFVNHTSCECEGIGQFYFRRRQAGDFAKLVENLLQRQIFSAENIAFARLPFFERGNVPAGAWDSR